MIKKLMAFLFLAAVVGTAVLLVMSREKTAAAEAAKIMLAARIKGA